jgi:uncharacterized membrane protein YhaH (DUF805 family)
MDKTEFKDVLLLLVPLLLVWLVMLIAGLADLVRRERTRGPKWVWYLVVVCFSIIGPVLYFLLGRDET